MSETIALIIIALGLVFDLVGCIGLVRMPNVYAGLQSAAKCVTLGTCSILFGAFLLFPADPTGIKALVCILFIAITTPTGAHALARAAHKFGIHVDKHAVVDQYEEDIDHHQESETE